jgi:hypothetical protein
MSKNHLEERIATLEGHVAKLQAELDALRQPKDWRSTIGMFGNDPIMKEIQDEALRIREADRRKARRRPMAKQKSKR